MLGNEWHKLGVPKFAKPKGRKHSESAVVHTGNRYDTHIVIFVLMVS